MKYSFTQPHVWFVARNLTSYKYRQSYKYRYRQKDTNTATDSSVEKWNIQIDPARDGIVGHWLDQLVGGSRSGIGLGAVAAEKNKTWHTAALIHSVTTAAPMHSVTMHKRAVHSVILHQRTLHTVLHYTNAKCYRKEQCHTTTLNCVNSSTCSLIFCRFALNFCQSPAWKGWEIARLTTVIETLKCETIGRLLIQTR